MDEPNQPEMTRRCGGRGHEGELRAVNAELATLLRSKPAELAFGADLAARDDLVICGILGGKDVGKSTLINALAEAPVSVDEAEVGKGTDRPIAYAHRAAEAAVRHRLTPEAAGSSLRVQWHEADPVRNAVLIDLPDFDSQFQDHLQIVLDVAPLLDRIIWVVTPRKIGDREWVRMLQYVVKDLRNVYVVLNKADEFLADLEPPSKSGRTNGFSAKTFWPAHLEWMSSVLTQIGCPSHDDRRFLLAGGYADEHRFVQRVGELWDDPEWAKYGDEKPAVTQIAQRVSNELDRLRSRVLEEVPEHEAEAIKRANLARQTETNIDRLRRHYDLQHVFDGLSSVCEEVYVQQLLDDAISEADRFALAADLARRVRTERDLADELLEQRVERWPLLQLAYWPFGWLARAVAPIRRLVPASRSDRAGDGGPHAPPDAVAPAGLPRQRDQIDLLRSTLLRDQAALANRLELGEELPEARVLEDRFRAAADRLPGQVEAQMMAALTKGRRRSRLGGFLGNVVLWLLLLWFPLLQPVAAGLLEIYAEEGGFRWAHGVYRVVSALSAVHLLAGLAVVVGIYLALIAGMYVRCLQSVRSAMAEHLSLSAEAPLPAAVDSLLVEELAAPLLRPFRERLARLRELLDRVERIADGPGSGDV